MNHCCHIDEATGKGCGQPARFHIQSPDAIYDDYTHACAGHVADLACEDDVVEPLPPSRFDALWYAALGAVAVAALAALLAAGWWPR